MHALAQQRCLNHLDREAVARCPECAQFYCRECVVEHDDRVLCAACLRRLNVTAGAAAFPLAAAARLVLGVFSVLFAWLFFYLAGRVLLSIPASFHDGSFWHSP